MEVISISTDTVFSHIMFKKTSPTVKHVKYPMASDPSGAVARAYGVWNSGSGLNRRGRFIINPKGTVMAVEADSGKVLWKTDDSYRGPPILYHDWVMTQTGGGSASATAEAKVFNLLTGKYVMRQHPMTGETIPWTWVRFKGCNTAVASENLLMAIAVVPGAEWMELVVEVRGPEGFPARELAEEVVDTVRFAVLSDRRLRLRGEDKPLERDRIELISKRMADAYIGDAEAEASLPNGEDGEPS